LLARRSLGEEGREGGYGSEISQPLGHIQKMIFKKNNKIISWIFALIFIAIAASFISSYREPTDNFYMAEVSNPVVTAADAVKQSGTALEKKIIVSSGKNSSGTSAAPVAENKPLQNQIIQEPTDKLATEDLIKIAFVAGDGKYDTFVQKGATVYDAMAKLASSTSFSFNAKYYSGLGYFIDAINGVKNANGNYWTLYVNGKYATVGASAYILSENDSVEWKYTNKTD